MVFYRIGERVFNTKKASYEYCKETLYTLLYEGVNQGDYGEVYQSRGDSYFDYFVDLVNVHPYKTEIIGTGISGFKIQLNEYRHITLTVLRSDNTSKEISWVRTCKFTHKPYS